MIKVKFKAKADNGFVKFPGTISKRHCEFISSGAVEKYSNSNLFEDMISIFVRKNMGLPMGRSVLLGDLPDTVTYKTGFLYTFEFTVND